MTHEGFLSAIIESPNDDALRLIYADFLEDQGEQERAEFIRVQCELARLPESDPRREDLEAREKALLLKHQRTWAGPLWGMCHEWTYRRGFIEEITLQAEDFVENADIIFHAGPVREVCLHDAGDVVDQLAACPHLSRLRVLRLEENGLEDVGTTALAGSPHLGGLEVLDLGNNHISEVGAEALAASPFLAGLKELYLDYNHIGAAGADALARSPHLANLTLLELDHNFFFEGDDEQEEEAVKALEERFGDRVHF